MVSVSVVKVSGVTLNGSSVSAGAALSSTGCACVRVVVDDADATVILRAATDAFDLRDMTLMSEFIIIPSNENRNLKIVRSSRPSLYFHMVSVYNLTDSECL